jgi:hypothetical protein
LYLQFDLIPWGFDAMRLIMRGGYQQAGVSTVVKSTAENPYSVCIDALPEPNLT